MKTTFDLPPDLVQKLKLRALHDRRKLKDLAADLLRQGLTSKSPAKKSAAPTVVKDKKTGLPVIQSRRPFKAPHLTPDQISDILLQQEVEWAHAAS